MANSELLREWNVLCILSMGIIRSLRWIVPNKHKAQILAMISNSGELVSEVETENSAWHLSSHHLWLQDWEVR